MIMKKTTAQKKSKATKDTAKKIIRKNKSDTQISDTESPSEKPDKIEPRSEYVVVGIGASAGGLAAFKQFLEALPNNTGMAFVLIQHLDPNHESLMADLLSKYTTMPVLPAGDAMPIKPNHVYMIPPNKFIKVRDGGLFLDEPVKRRGIRMPIDYFFRSLADQRRELAIGVVLSGTGGDGTQGLREIKAQGGMIMVQDPKTAEYDGMPRSAVATGLVDFELPISKMPEVIMQWVQHPYIGGRDKKTAHYTDATEHYKSIISVLRAHTDYDFRCYKRGTLSRRIQRRMGLHHIREVEDYLKFLRNDKDEIRQLFRDLLISVTAFFREPEAWSYLETEVIAKIIAEKTGRNSTLRVWAPGCATGEEAYSIGMVVFDQLARQRKNLTLQLFATDLDEDAIEKARFAVYPASISDDVPQERLKKHFTETGDGRYRINKRLRDSIVFATQNVIADPPFSKLDLVTCRNLLIYLEPHVQKELFSMFHFALNKGGFMFLGASETIGREGNLFKEISKQWRIFQKIGTSRPRSLRNTYTAPQAPNKDNALVSNIDLQSSPVEVSKRILLDRFAPACVVIDRSYDTKFLQGPVRNYLDFPSGEPTQNIVSMCAEGLRSNLRRAIVKSIQNDSPVSDVAPKVKRGDSFISVDITVEPLPREKSKEQLLLVVFRDKDEPSPQQPSSSSSSLETIKSKKAKADLVSRDAIDSEDSDGDDMHRQLEHDLLATREDLQTTIEEFETSNEELKASNEEVTSMNEELQSTNEELETSREELQSLNEELSTVNNQLEDKVVQVEEANNDLSNLLSSTEIATIFLDTDFHIRRFTPATSGLLHVIDSDIGRPVSDLASSFNDKHLHSDARQVLRKLLPIEREVFLIPVEDTPASSALAEKTANKTKEKSEACFIRRILPYRTADNRIDGVVVTYTDITRLRTSLTKLESREKQAAVISEIGQAALSGETLSSLFSMAVEGLQEALSSDYSKILKLLPEENKLLLVEGLGWKRGLIGKAKVNVGTASQAGYTLRSTQPILVGDLRQERRFSGPDLLTSHQVASGISVIIGKKEHPWGILATHSKEKNKYTSDDVNFVQSLANTLWEALTRTEYEKDLNRRLTEIDAIYETAPTGLCYLDTNLRYVRINKLQAEINGHSIEAHYGKTVREILPELADKLEPAFRQVLDTGQPVIDVEISGSTEAKKVGHYLSSYYPFRFNGSITGINCVVRDITSQKEAENALRLSKERLELAWGASGGGVIEHTVPLDGSPIISKECANLLGYEIKEVPSGNDIVKWISELLHPDQRETIKQTYTEFLKGKTDKLKLETRLLHKSGQWIWVHANFKIIDRANSRTAKNVIGILLDITELKEAEFSIRESEERLRLAKNASRLGIHVYDPKTETVQWDDRIRELWGVSKDKKIDYSVFEAGLHPEDRQRTREAIEKGLDPKGNGHVEVDYRIISPIDGVTRWISATGETTFENGVPVRMIGAVQDITERKQIEQDLRKADQRKDEFLAILAHELRNPMAVISSGLDVMKMAVDNPEILAETQTLMGKQIIQLTNLVNDLLDVARYTRDKLELRKAIVPLAEVIRDAVDSVFPLLQKRNHELTLKIPKKPILVEVDSGRMCQVISNLLTNAAKFSPESGHIEISVRALRSKKVNIAIKDNGEGISAAGQESIFDMFTQIDNKLEGSSAGLGIGLTLAKGLVQKHGGTIKVSSEGKDQGSTFTVTIPIAEAPPKTVQKKSAPPTETKKRSLKILVAEDNEPAASTLATLLTLKGHTVKIAKDGKEAVQKAARIKPNLIIMDLGMPNMGGNEAASIIRKQKWASSSYLVALSGWGQDADKEFSTKSGFDHHLTKPASSSDLDGVLRAATKNVD